MVYRKVLSPVICGILRDAETAHDIALCLLAHVNRHRGLCEYVARHTRVDDPRLQQKILGISFRSPIGVAAGFDKNGVALRSLEALGFSHIEMGTITPRYQEGNPRPQMSRFPKEGAIINRMGFNNDGMESIPGRLAIRSEKWIPLGISLGKGKDTPLEKAARDYQAVLRTLHNYGDYFVLNVSSPNTQGLRTLQGKEQLTLLLERVQRTLHAYPRLYQMQDGIERLPKPLLVKLSPDLTWSEIDELIEVCLAHQVSGLIATNTTTGRKGLRTLTTEMGGLSGKPLFPRSLEIVRYLRRNLPLGFPIIGVGGISTADDAYMMLRAGADLLQSYTGFVYGGPFFARELNRGILKRMEREGITHISQLHG